MAVTQSHFRYGVNELAESTHGWYAPEDTSPAPGGIALNTTFLLRFTLQCDASAQSNIDPEFQYRKNGGGWTQISIISSTVRAVTPTCWANAAHTTKRLSGTGTFEASSNGCTTDGIAGGNNFDIVASGNGETECALQLVSADLAPGDLIEFRLTRDGGVLLDTYSVTPTLQLQAAVTRKPVVTGPFPFPKSVPDFLPSFPSADVTVGLSGVAATVVAGALGAALTLGMTGTNVVATGEVGSLSGNFTAYPVYDRSKTVTGPFPFPKELPAFPISSADREVALVGVSATGSVGFLYPPVPVFDHLPERGPFPFLTGSFFQFREQPRAVIFNTTDINPGPLSSATLVTGLGTLTPGITADLTGTNVLGTTGLGSLTVNADSTEALSGLSATGSVGTLTPGITQALTGQEATSGLGSFAASSPGEATLSGVAASGSVGNLTVAAVPIDSPDVWSSEVTIVRAVSSTVVITRSMSSEVER